MSLVKRGKEKCIQGAIAMVQKVGCLPCMLGLIPSSPYETVDYLGWLLEVKCPPSCTISYKMVCVFVLLVVSGFTLHSGILLGTAWDVVD